MIQADRDWIDEKQKFRLLRIAREYDKLADAAALQEAPLAEHAKSSGGRFHSKAWCCVFRSLTRRRRASTERLRLVSTGKCLPVDFAGISQRNPLLHYTKKIVADATEHDDRGDGPHDEYGGHVFISSYKWRTDERGSRFQEPEGLEPVQQVHSANLLGNKRQTICPADDKDKSGSDVNEGSARFSARRS
jgi:hypothetical protein